MIAEAWRRQGRAGTAAGIEFKVGDAHRLPLEDGCFHACRSDRVFQHLADPAQALAELVRVARPGAAIVVSEPDWETLTLDSGDRATTRRVVQFIADRSVRQGWIGRQLPRAFKQQGLLDVQVDAAVVTLTDYELADTLWSLTRNAGQGRDAGVIGTEEMVTWLRDLQESGREGRFFGAHLGFVVSGRKP
jgi:SAM-dependent methyltransferase